MRATAVPVEGNLVRLTVEVDEPEVDRMLDDTVRTLSRQIRVPGFRPGKVPRQVLEARLGGAVALRSEALREALPDLYAQAVLDTEVDPISSPDIDITAGEETGPVSFDAVVQVRPLVAIPGYQGLRVTVPAVTATDEEVEAQVDRLRDTDAELAVVERPAQDGDHVTIDLRPAGEGGGDGVEDYVYELGSDTALPGLDEALRGTRPGEVVEVTPPAPEGGLTQTYRVLVKEVQEKRLPPATDEWAAESSEFSTVEELRADLRQRLDQMKRLQATLTLRRGAAEAVAALVDEDEVPPVLVTEEAQERLETVVNRLAEQKISLDDYLTATGRTPEELEAEARAEALEAVKLDLALRALAEAESLEVDDDELDAEVEAMAERLSVSPEDLRHRLDHAGRTAAVRSGLRKGKAMAWLHDHVEVVDDEGRPVPREALRPDGEEGADDGTGDEAEAHDAAPTEPDDVSEETEE
jgi:trigger factor